MRPPRPPRPPSPQRSAELRRRFAQEARSERPDLATLCLLVGAEADGTLDEAGLDAAQVELDRLAGELPFRPGTPRAWAVALRDLLGERYGFHGVAADYQRLESSLLHEVVRRRRGLPILLSVVWLEVARRAGAPVYGVALPGHFVVGFGGESAAASGPGSAPLGERVLVDPYDGGRLLSGTDAEALVAGATGAELRASMLEPAAPLDVVARVLNNIRAWAAARPEQSAVGLWAVELALLLPAHAARLRYERAVLLVQRGSSRRGPGSWRRTRRWWRRWTRRSPRRCGGGADGSGDVELSVGGCGAGVGSPARAARLRAAVEGGGAPAGTASATASPCSWPPGPPPRGFSRPVSGWPWTGSCGPCPGRGGGRWRVRRWWSRRRRRGGSRVRGR